MIYLIQNFKDFKGELSINNLYDIAGAIIHFRSMKPMEIINSVFDNYYKLNSRVSKEDIIKYNDIETFMDTYHDFFSKEECDFMKEQCKYLGDTFTLDALMGNVLSLRQYYPY